MMVGAAARKYLPDPVESLCIPLPHLEEIPARVTAASNTPNTKRDMYMREGTSNRKHEAALCNVLESTTSSVHTVFVTAAHLPWQPLHPPVCTAAVGLLWAVAATAAALLHTLVWYAFTAAAAGAAATASTLLLCGSAFHKCGAFAGLPQTPPAAVPGHPMLLT